MKYTKALLMLLSCGFLASPVFSQTAKPQPSNASVTPFPQYPLNIRAAFIHGCLTDDKESPKPTEQRVRFCMCMLDRVQPKFTLAQFFDMASVFDNDKKRENALEAFLEDQAVECI